MQADRQTSDRDGLVLKVNKLPAAMKLQYEKEKLLETFFSVPVTGRGSSIFAKSLFMCDHLFILVSILMIF